MKEQQVTLRSVGISCQGNKIPVEQLQEKTFAINEIFYISKDGHSCTGNNLDGTYKVSYIDRSQGFINIKKVIPFNSPSFEDFIAFVKSDL